MQLGRHEIPFNDPSARRLLAAEGEDVGQEIVTLADGSDQTVRVVDVVSPDGPLRVIEGFLPAANGGTLQIEARTPADLAAACRPLIDSLLAEVRFE